MTLEFIDHTEHIQGELDACNVSAAAAFQIRKFNKTIANIEKTETG